MLSKLKRLSCPHCGQAHDPFAVLDHCQGWWRGRRWVDFCCPDCGRASHIELEGAHMAIGFVAETPTPRFEPQMRVSIPSLEARSTPEGMLVHLHHRRWFMVARS